jgi:hypothetical protein
MPEKQRRHQRPRHAPTPSLDFTPVALHFLGQEKVAVWRLMDDAIIASDGICHENNRISQQQIRITIPKN